MANPVAALAQPLIGTLASIDASLLDGDELVESICSLSRVRSALDAAWLALLAEADRRGVARRNGMRTTEDLIASITGDRRGVARRDVELGSQLASSPLVREGLAEGQLTRAKASELARVQGASDGEMAVLIGQAVTRNMDQVQALVGDWKARHDQPDPPVRNTLTISKTAISSRVEVCLDAARTAMLETALELAVARLGLPKEIPFEQRRAEGLAAVCRYFVDHVDTIKDRVGRAHLLAVVDLDVLQGASQALSRLGNGQVVTAEVALRIACDCNVSRVITKGRSEVLDVGRSTRTWSPAIAKAIIARDKHCVEPGCTAPPWATEIHHRTPWQEGGATSVEGGERRCWHHHDARHQQIENEKRVKRLAQHRPRPPDHHYQRLAS